MSRQRFFAVIAVTAAALAGALLANTGCGPATQPETDADGPRHTVRVGAILPMTGPAAQFGTWIRQGMEVGRDEVRELYPNVELRVSYEDSQGAPQQAVNAFQKFASENVDVVLVATSGETLAIAPLAERHGIVIITGTLIPGITEKSPLLIRNAASMRDETEKMASYLASRDPKPDVAIIYVNNDVGVYSKDRFTTVYQRAGGAVVGAEAYNPDATDFRAQLTKLRPTNPDVLYFLSYGEWGTLVKQARELGFTADFAGATPTEDASALKVAGSAAEGIIYTSADFDPEADDPAVKKFQAEYQNRHGALSEVYAATFRDNLHLIANAASDGHTGGQELIRAILDIGVFDGASGRTEFLEDRDVNKPVALYTIRDGEFVRYAPDAQ